MSGETETPNAETATPAPNGADTSAPVDKAAPAEAEEFLPDTAKSDAKPKEGKADDKADASKEDEGFLAETDDDDAEKDADAPGDADKDSAPEAYQPFELPEGLALEGDDLAQATALLRKHGRSQEEAQELVSYYANQQKKSLETFHQTLVDAHEQRLKDWAKETKADEEFGGKNLTASKASAAKALALEPSARKVLVEYGLDRNPAIFKLLARVGSKLSDDSLVRDDAGAPETVAPQRDADVMYS